MLGVHPLCPSTKSPPRTVLFQNLGDGNKIDLCPMQQEHQLTVHSSEFLMQVFLFLGGGCLHNTTLQILHFDDVRLLLVREKVAYLEQVL